MARRPVEPGRDRRWRRHPPGSAHRRRRDARRHGARHRIVPDHPGRIPGDAAVVPVARQAAPRGRGVDRQLRRGHRTAPGAVQGARARGDRSGPGGAMEALRVLRTTRKTAVKSRRAALQQLHNTLVAAPDEVRDRIRNLTRMRRLRACAAWRPDATRYRDPAVATRLSLKSLARRILALDDEIAALDLHIAPLVEEIAPDLLALEGVGVASAGELMVTAGENPDRLRSEASFAMLCGRLPAARIERQDAAPSPQSRGEPLGQLGPPHDRRVPHAHRPTNPNLRPAAYRRRAVQTRGDALPEALRGPRHLPCPHRPISHLTNMRASRAPSTSTAKSPTCQPAPHPHLHQVPAPPLQRQRPGRVQERQHHPSVARPHPRPPHPRPPARRLPPRQPLPPPQLPPALPLPHRGHQRQRQGQQDGRTTSLPPTSTSDRCPAPKASSGPASPSKSSTSSPPPTPTSMRPTPCNAPAMPSSVRSARPETPPHDPPHVDH